ncbi:mCG147329 [Mus musculus]|nr:mCG147329 [Mus musculus]
MLLYYINNRSSHCILRNFRFSSRFGTSRIGLTWRNAFLQKLYGINSVLVMRIICVRDSSSTIVPPILLMSPQTSPTWQGKCFWSAIVVQNEFLSGHG